MKIATLILAALPVALPWKQVESGMEYIKPGHPPRVCGFVSDPMPRKTYHDGPMDKMVYQYYTTSVAKRIVTGEADGLDEAKKAVEQVCK